MKLQPGPSGRHGRRVGRALALVASVAIHASVLAFLALPAIADGVAASRRDDDVLVRTVQAAGTLKPAPDTAGPLPPRTPTAGDRALPTGCRGDTYTGIGASVNQAGFIVDLAVGGPAEQAGLRPGDAILNLEDLPINVYAVGHPVSLKLLREGRQVEATVRIDAICNEPPAPVA
jgi:S1-C subfamily serine protease